MHEYFDKFNFNIYLKKSMIKQIMIRNTPKDFIKGHIFSIFYEMISILGIFKTNLKRKINQI